MTVRSSNPNKSRVFHILTKSMAIENHLNFPNHKPLPIMHQVLIMITAGTPSDLNEVKNEAGQMGQNGGVLGGIGINK